MSRRVVHTCIAVCIAFGVACSATTASAAPVDLLCPITATVTSTPGVGLIAHNVQLSGTATAGTPGSPVACSSFLSGTPYAGGSGPITGSGQLSCIGLGVTGLTGHVAGTIPITWNDGDHSTISWSLTATALAAPILQLTVTGGELQGASGVMVPVPTGINGNCLLSPIKTLSLTGVILLAQL